MNAVLLARAMLDGVAMPDGRHWTWCGHDHIRNRKGELVRVELWAGICRWCGGKFQIKQKLMLGKPAFNFKTQNCPEHRGQRKPVASTSKAAQCTRALALPDDIRDLM